MESFLCCSVCNQLLFLYLFFLSELQISTFTHIFNYSLAFLFIFKHFFFLVLGQIQSQLSFPCLSVCQIISLGSFSFLILPFLVILGLRFSSIGHIQSGTHHLLVYQSFKLYLFNILYFYYHLHQ